MKLPLLAAIIVVLSLIACSGSATSTPDIGPENTPAATAEGTEPPTASASPTPRTLGNTLIETPEYTGVIISENGASEFGYLLDEASTAFWEPSSDDVSRAEACIRQHLVSLQQNLDLDTYQQEIHNSADSHQ